MSELFAWVRRWRRVFVLFASCLPLQAWAGSPPTPHWSTATSLSTDDGYADLNWGVRGDGEVAFYRLTERFDGQSSVHFVDHPTTRLYRISPGLYEFWVQACRRDAAGYPDCGAQSPRLELTVTDAVGQGTALPGGGKKGGDELTSPGGFTPGRWHNPDREGHGWSFYWKSRLSLPEGNPMYGKAYDLIGLWYTYEAKRKYPEDPANCPEGSGGNECVWIYDEYRPVYAWLTFTSMTAHQAQGSIYIRRSGTNINVGAVNVLFQGPGNATVGWDAHFLHQDLQGVDNIEMLVGPDPDPVDNPAHYSGLWQAPGQDYFVAHGLGIYSESVEVLFEDHNGHPSWILAAGDVPDPGPTDLCFFYVAEGFAPGTTGAMVFHEDGCDPEHPIPPINPNGFREFTGFETEAFWVDISLPGGSAPNHFSAGSANNPHTLSKALSFHRISYDSPSGSTCDLDADSAGCALELTWFTDGNNPQASAFAFETGSGDRAIIDTAMAMQDQAWSPDGAGEYVFELRMGDTPNSSLMGVSEAFHVSGQGSPPPVASDPETPPPPAGAPNMTPTVASSETGATAGEFAVSPTGSAGYRIPILTAPGSGGLAPSVALVYDSQAGNGPLGVGWQIDGFSVISRCAQTLEQDGDPAVQRITFSAQDRFCLDGQRLMAVDGAYGAHGTEYRKEIDDYTRVVSYGGGIDGPSYFRAWSRDGVVVEFGRTGDSRIETRASGVAKVAYTWAQNRLEDTAGNYVLYQYNERGSGPVDFVLAKIRYTGNTNAGTQPYAELRFQYTQGRDDDGLVYMSGVAASHSRLLKRIDSLSRVDTGHPLEHLRAYHLNYGVDGWGRAALEGVTECRDASGSVCFAPTEFTWQKSEHVISPYGPNAASLFTTDFRGLALGDATGDGRADLLITERDGAGFEFGIARGSANGDFTMGAERFELPEGEATGQPVALTVIDLNADGYQDVVYVRETAGEISWYARLAGPGGMGEEFVILENCCNALSPTLLQVMDFNGDGLSDIMTQRPTQVFEDASEIVVLINDFAPGDALPSFREPHVIDVNDHELFPAMTLKGWEVTDAIPSIAFQSGGTAAGRVDDFYGDGSADILVRLSRGYRRCMFSPCQPDGPEPPERGLFRISESGDEVPTDGPAIPDPAEEWALVTFYLVFFADENGDYSTYEVVATGAGDDCGVPDICNLYYEHPEVVRTLPADINADGLADVAYLDEDHTWYYRINTGTGFLPPKLIGTLPDEERARQARIIDVNGDHYPELLYPDLLDNDSARWLVMYNNLGRGFSAPMASSIPVGNVAQGDASILLDFTSDGIIDHLMIDLRADGQGAESDTTRLRRGVNLFDLQTRRAVNVITAIENGLGARTEITYAPLTDPDVHTRMNNSANAYWGEGSAVYDLSVPYYVVESVAQSAPTFASQAATSERSYHYVGAKIQAGGRGFLGFAEVVEWDAQTAVRTNTRYRQKFPFSGRVADSSVFLSNAQYKTDIISDISHKIPNEWPHITATTGIPGHDAHGTLIGYSIREYQAVESIKSAGTWAVRSPADLSRGYTLDGQFREKTLTTRSFDILGNILAGEEQKFAQDGTSPWSRVTTDNDWINDLAQWRLGRLESTQVSHWRSGAATIWRTSSYAYHPHSDLIVRETAEPGNPDRQVVTDYTLDKFGNRIGTKVTGVGMAPRETTMNYDGLGRFAVETRNAYGQVTQLIDKWDEFGNPTEAFNIDGVGTIAAMDHMGRPFASYTQTGAWQRTILGMGGQGQCPAGTAYHAVATGGGAPVSVECFDRLGRKMRSASEGLLGSWIRTDSYFDASGRPERVSEPYFQGQTRYWNTTQYDLLGRPTRAVAANGLVEEVRYDFQASHCNTADSQDVVSSRYTPGSLDAAGPRAVLTRSNPGDGSIRDRLERRNVAGEIVQVLDDQCGKVAYGYDAVGNLIETIGIDGAVITIDYDALGLTKVQMNDPDKGLWQYASNALGEVTRQLDSKQQAIDFEYDLMGRVTHRRELSGVGSLNDNFYQVENHEIRHWNNSTAPGVTGRGQLTREEYRTGESGAVLHRRDYGYDSYGRVTQVEHVLEGESFTESTTYDQFGRVFQRFDASGDSRGVRFVYNDRGYVTEIKEARDGEDGVVYQAIQAMDPRGNPIAMTLGNGAEVFAEYDPTSGYVQTLEAYQPNGQQMQFVEYSFDRLGNLEWRHDRSGTNDLREDFEYDLLDRLERVMLTAPQQGLHLEETQSMAYSASGNITYKSGVGGYTYGAGQAGPHAVTQAGAVTYTYDANGNQQWSSDGRTIEYSVFDKPTRIQKGANTTEFSYGLGNRRYKRVDNNAVDQQKTTWTVGSVEWIEGATADYFKRYIGGVAIVDYYPASQETDAWYLTKDHLGSIHSISNSNGVKVGESHFGPWGARQGSDWQSPLSGAGLIVANDFTTRGFTGHEHTDALGVIHMNGRIYDPRLGRFLQADPFVQAPRNGQSLNRYSYALNNPLSYTDPSGYFFKRLIRKWGRVIVAVIISIYLPGAQGVLATTFNVTSKLAQAAITGFIAGGITGGFKGAVKGAFFAAITYGVDQAFNQFGAENIDLATGQLAPDAKDMERLFGPGVTPESGLFRITVGPKGEFDSAVKILESELNQFDIIFTNGAKNNFPSAVRNGTTHVAQFNGAVSNYVLNFNQTAGLVADLAQATGDVLGTYLGVGHTDLAKNLAGVLDAASSSGVRGLRLIGHSQGGAITTSALRYAADSGLSLHSVAGVQLNGAPINNFYATGKLSRKISTKIGNRYQFADGVNAVLGANFLSNPLRLPFSLVRSPHLFSSDASLSPHTTPCGARIQLCP